MGLQDGLPRRYAPRNDDITGYARALFRKRRIEAHICIAFVAYSIYKELERRLLESGSELSLKRASELTHTMYALNCLLPGDALPQQIMLNMDEEQKSLHTLIHPT
jgi:hypothetical protein